MRLGTACHQLWVNLHVEIKAFKWDSEQVQNTLRAATECTLAVFIALILHVENPFWPAISALIVVQGTVGATLAKSGL